MSMTTLFPLRKTGKRPSIEDLIEESGLPAPSREYLFASAIGRKWRFDYAWPEHRIALEIEGAVFGRMVTTVEGDRVRVGGRHNTGAGMQADCEKYSWAAILGWRVIRATTTMVRDGDAIELLKQAFTYGKGRTNGSSSETRA